MNINSILRSTISDLHKASDNKIINNGEVELKHVEVNPGTVSPEKIDKAVNALNAAASKVDARISFSYHEKINRVVMRVVDPVTKEVVKQFPSRDMIDILESINDAIGLFVDKQG